MVKQTIQIFGRIKPTKGKVGVSTRDFLLGLVLTRWLVRDTVLYYNINSVRLCYCYSGISGLADLCYITQLGKYANTDILRKNDSVVSVKLPTDRTYNDYVLILWVDVRFGKWGHFKLDTCYMYVPPNGRHSFTNIGTARQLTYPVTVVDSYQSKSLSLQRRHAYSRIVTQEIASCLIHFCFHSLSFVACHTEFQAQSACRL